MSSTRPFLVLLALLVPGLVVAPGAAQATTGADLSLFSISKSENRNQVVYAVQVDGACRPMGEAPVHAYWRMLEKGPGATEPLLSREERAYGMVDQRTVGDRLVQMRLNALPDRTISIRTGKSGDACTATASATVASTPVTLYNVHARLRRFFFGVESLTLTGRAPASGAVVQEVLKP